ncbi:RHS repeat domain-containing protein [Lysobacter fragariae]
MRARNWFLSDGNTAEILARKASRTFDARNRVTSLVFPDGRGDQAWTYTPDGLPGQITTYNGANQTQPVINAYHYNHRRMLDGQGESVSQTGWYTWGIGYGYTTSGNLAVHTYPDNLTVDYQPNALGQPTQVGTFATGVSYHPNGAIAQFTYGNGIVHTLTQNTRGLPEKSCDAFGACGSAAVLNDSYDFDANGNVAAISDGVGITQRGNRTMTYDGLDRLKTAVSPMFGATGASYSYDVLDNLTRVTVGGTAARDQYYCYDSIGTGATWRLTNVKTGSCSGASVIGLGYDVQGNLANKNGQGFNFDYGNRLRAATSLETYRYDGLGRRVLAYSVQGLGNILSQYSQGGQLMYQYDQRQGKYLAFLSLGGSLVAIREKLVAGGAVTVKYQHTDALGSPVAVTDAGRNVIERSEFEPYGQLLNRPLHDGPGYTGHVSDKATGLSYMQQRYYDPGIGRFLSVDPVTVDGGTGANFNRYWYANNNPYKFTDPDGRQACTQSGTFCMRSEVERREIAEKQEAQPSRSTRPTQWMEPRNYSEVVSGALDADRALWAGRKLTDNEARVGKGVHRTLDTSTARVGYAPFGPGAITPGQTIYFSKALFPNGPCSDFTTCYGGSYLALFVHEISHVWQAQMGKSPVAGHFQMTDPLNVGPYLTPAQFRLYPTPQGLDTERAADWYKHNYFMNQGAK